MNGPIAVTGTTGTVGGRVLSVLATADVDVVALTRRPHNPPGSARQAIADYNDPPALRRALEGTRTLVLVTSDGESTAMLRHHSNLLEAATACGIEHVVLLSSLDADTDSPFCYARTAAATEQQLAGTGLPWSIGRASIFTEFFVDEWVTPARNTKEIRLPANDAAVSFVSRIDVADSLAALATRAPTFKHHHLTGSESLSLDSVAGYATIHHRCPIRYLDITPQQHRVELALADTDPWWSYAYATMFASIRQHRWNHVSTDVQTLTGHVPTSLQAILDGSQAAR